jgi:hypothetical protein
VNRSTRPLVSFPVPPASHLQRKTHLLQPRPQKTPHKELEPLQLGLDDNEFEVCLRVHVPRLVLHKLNLPALVSARAHLLVRLQRSPWPGSSARLPAAGSAPARAPSAPPAMAASRARRARRPTIASTPAGRASPAASCRRRLRQAGHRCPWWLKKAGASWRVI